MRCCPCSPRSNRATHSSRHAGGHLRQGILPGRHHEVEAEQARASGLEIAQCRNERLQLEFFDVGAVVLFAQGRLDGAETSWSTATAPGCRASTVRSNTAHSVRRCLRRLCHRAPPRPLLVQIAGVLSLRAVDVRASERRRLRGLVVALLAGVLVMVALTGASAGTPRFDECVGAGCDGDDVTLSGASEVPDRVPGSTPVCLHDAGCGGAHSAGTSGLTLAALPAGLADLVATRPQGAARRAAAALRSLLFSRQLYRPPRFA